jgi:sulfopyruvate decarboxylase TPP-binding subunit
MASDVSTAPAASVLHARTVLEQLQHLGITHIVWLPDTETGAMQAALAVFPFTVVPVCREGEAVAVALGLWIGGKNPVVSIQNTGFFEQGDSLRGLALDLHLPLLLMIGYRGWRHGAPTEDSAAIYLEPLLRAWGVPHFLLERDEDVGVIEQAYRLAHTERRPVAVLIGSEYTPDSPETREA